jgi:hypothetical protein
MMNVGKNRIEVTAIRPETSISQNKNFWQDETGDKYKIGDKNPR